jgi:hypothetical protein
MNQDILYIKSKCKLSNAPKLFADLFTLGHATCIVAANAGMQVEEVNNALALWATLLAIFAVNDVLQKLLEFKISIENISVRQCDV